MKLVSLAAVILVCGCGSNPWHQGDGDSDDAGTASDARADTGSPKKDSGLGTPDTGTPTTTASLEMVSGNGGTVPSGWPTTDPIRVRARDAQGHVVVGDKVAFDLNTGSSLHLQILDGTNTVATDSDGIASVTYNAFPIDQNKGHEVETVTAKWNGLSVDFNIIITQVPSGVWAAPPLFEISVPDTSPDLGSVKGGTTIVGAIQAIAVYQQGQDYGAGVGGWGFRLTKSEDLLNAGDVSCVGNGGTAIADSAGKMSCDLIAPSKPGDYYFTMLAGGQIKWDGHVKVTP